MCLYPKLIYNKKYIANKKNGGIIPAISDERTKLVSVGCQKCMECRKQKQREWQVRLSEDIRHEKNGKFVTLTFSNESIKELSEKIEGLSGYELDNEIATKAVRLFLERWRKEHKKSIRHWLITEIGHHGTENIHLHGIMWTNESIEKIRKHWKYGYVYPRNEEEEKKNFVTEKTVNYITKYVTKQDEKHKEYKAKILTSAGIGKGYLTRTESERNKYKKGETIETYKTKSGHKIAMPIYWRNKIYTEEEREKLWIEKLDKEERWVCGEKVSIEKEEKAYYNILNHYREKNKRLGYGDDKINWERKEYENKRRMLKIQQRIEKENAPQALRGLGIAPESAESINTPLIEEKQSAITWGKEMS